MKKFLTFVFLLLGFSFFSITFSEACSYYEHSASDYERNSYYKCLQEKRTEAERNNEMEKANRLRNEEMRARKVGRTIKERRSIKPLPKRPFCNILC